MRESECGEDRWLEIVVLHESADPISDPDRIDWGLCTRYPSVEAAEADAGKHGRVWVREVSSWTRTSTPR